MNNMTKQKAGQQLSLNKLSDILELYCDDKFVSPLVVGDVELSLYFLENKRSKTLHVYICDYAEEILNSIISCKEDGYKDNIEKAKIILEDLLKIKSRFKPWK